MGGLTMANKIEFDLKDVETLASKGLTENQIAVSLGVSRSTIQRRKRECEAFEASFKKGQIMGIHKVKNALFESATHPEKPNVLAMKTYLERVEGSAKLEIKSEVEVTDSRQVEDAIKYLTNAGIDIDSL
jgi:biotin operon repressor